MVEAAAEESPLVLVVDDIHAADNASAAILHMVARKLPRTRLLLILTGRPSELRMAAAPAALVTDSTVEALRRLELEPLGPEAAARLVAAVTTGGDASRGEPPTERILRASRGNPLAIELLTREWASQEPSSLLRDLEAMDTQPVASLGIPRAIGAVFERQVRRLDAACRAALDLAAVLGRRRFGGALPRTGRCGSCIECGGTVGSRTDPDGPCSRTHRTSEHEARRALACKVANGSVKSRSSQGCTRAPT